MAKIFLVFLLLISTFNPGHCANTRKVYVKGQIFCMDAKKELQPIRDGTVDLMEIDSAPPRDSFLSNFQDTDDIISTTHFSDSGKFEISGSEIEPISVPEFYLRFNLPCPAIDYCADHSYSGRCASSPSKSKTFSTVARFTYLLEQNNAQLDNQRSFYDVTCYIGVKTSEGTFEGFSCSGGLTP
ncbi:hypothetical protein PFISCL1PPCAC_17653, partial [Pristionchus fissidentatus]